MLDKHTHQLYFGVCKYLVCGHIFNVKISSGVKDVHSHMLENCFEDIDSLPLDRSYACILVYRTHCALHNSSLGSETIMDKWCHCQNI